MFVKSFQDVRGEKLPVVRFNESGKKDTQKCPDFCVEDWKIDPGVKKFQNFKSLAVTKIARRAKSGGYVWLC